MALTPGGGRSPSTQPRPSPSPTGKPRPPRPARGGRKFVWPRSATVSVLRLGVLIGGLVIIADLITLLFQQRTFSADDAQSLEQVDLMVNIVLYSLLGGLVVRDTGVMFAGVVAGLFASVLDAIVTSAAAVMTPPPVPIGSGELTAAVQDHFIWNLVIGTAFAGMSGVVYAIMQRSGGRRSR